MDLGDLGEFLEPEHLTFKLHGVTYKVAPCSADVGLRLQRMVAESQKEPDSRDLSEVSGLSVRELQEMVLGRENTDALRAAVSLAEIQDIFFLAFWWQCGRPEVVEAYLHGGGPGKAKAPRTRTSTAAASTTRKRASTSGTRSRTASSRKKPATR